MKTGLTKRFSVKVLHEFILYAEDEPRARSRTLQIMGPSYEILSVEQLPPLEEEVQSPVIDVAPARETRQPK